MPRARHARRPPAACSSRHGPARGRSARSATAPSTACPGASPSRPTTSATSSSPTSTRTSACRAWASKRGLGEDLVVAPYATALAAMVDPVAAARNFAALAAVGALGRLRLLRGPRLHRRRGVPDGATVAIVRAYMAHHQGMTLVALANVLHDGVMRARFHAEPMVQATELLLQERTPRDVAVARPRAEEVDVPAHVRELVAPVFRRFTTPHSRLPRTHLLSNGRYAVMLTAAGSGYSRCARPRRHPLARGRDARSLGHLRLPARRRERRGLVGRLPAERRRADRLRARPSPRTARSSIGATARSRPRSRSSSRPRTTPRSGASRSRTWGRGSAEIELTSYAEVVLAPPAADAAHPAFSNLFVQTEFARRPRRAAGDPPPALAGGDRGLGRPHVVVEGAARGRRPVRDRPRPLPGPRPRRSAPRCPSSTAAAVEHRGLGARSDLQPAAPDPARPGRAAPASSSRRWSRRRARPRSALADKYRDPATFERTVTLAWTQAQVQLHHLGIEPDEAHLFQRLANRILYSDPRAARRAGRAATRTRPAPSALWAHGISGDLPIVLVRIDEPEDRGIVRQLLRAHEYWRMKGLAVDLVILNEKAHSYVQELQTALEALVRTSQSAPRPERSETHGGVFILRANLLSPTDHDGPAVGGPGRAPEPPRHARRAGRARRAARRRRGPSRAAAGQGRGGRARRRPRASSLEFFNGLGGFGDGGREYVTVLGEGQWTPAPWVNVVANPRFGFQVSESGAGYTWAVNSRENQLTPWSNDPVSDPPGEAFYVRDEETGELWGPTAAADPRGRVPLRRPPRAGLQPLRAHLARHRAGAPAVRPARRSGQDLAADDREPVRPGRAASRSPPTSSGCWAPRAARTRRPSSPRSTRRPARCSRATPGTPTSRAASRSPTSAAAQTAWTADRAEFLGRNGTLDHPAALERGDARCPGGSAPGSTRARRSRSSIELRARRPGRDRLPARPGRRPLEAARALVARYRAADVDAHPDATVTTQLGRHRWAPSR